MNLRLALGLSLCALAAPALSFAQTPAAQHLDAPTAGDLRLLRPLAARGAVGIVHHPDDGPGARVTVVVAVNAPLATVHRVIAEASEWPAFVPAMRSVELLSRAGRRAAYRFGSTGPMLDVNATCAISEVSDRRIDFAVQQSDFGPAGARWDLVEESPTSTLVAVTTWSDPSQGHWLLRQAAASNPSATAGMNLAVDTSLALAVARRATSLSGVALSARPARMVAPVSDPTPLPLGPWVELTRRVYVVVFSLAPDGALAQINVAGQAGTSPEAVMRRVDDVAGYPSHVPGVRSAVREGGTELAPRFRVTVGGSWDSASGAVVREHEGDRSVTVRGLDGDLADSRWRWDLSPDPGGATLVQLSGGADRELGSLFTRVAASREPYLLGGISALRRLVWLRYMLNGLR